MDCPSHLTRATTDQSDRHPPLDAWSLAPLLDAESDGFSGGPAIHSVSAGRHRTACIETPAYLVTAPAFE